MKTTFTTSNGYVTISYDEFLTENRITRSFTAPADGGYVREGDGQACVRLGHSGSTLRASSDTLLATIKREYRAMRAAEKRQLAKI